MSELERVVSTLVRNIEAKFPQYLAAPFRVHDMHEQLIPYRVHRRELGVETNEYYELALTRLLSGEGGYLLAPEEVRTALQSELRSANPDSARFRQFGNVDVKLSELALNVNASGTTAAAPAAATAKTVPAASGTAATQEHVVDRPAAVKRSGASVEEAIAITTTSPTPALTAAILAKAAAAPAHRRSRSPAGKTPSASSKEKRMPASQRTTTAAALGGKCRYCQGTLPAGRDLTYCPHCGQDLTVHHCPACSTELEVGWKFCVTCGRSVEE